MSRQRLLSTIFLAGALVAPLVTAGCADHHYYRADVAYYGTWTPGEAVYYRQWITERRYEYRDYDRLDRDRQREYWEWRRTHGDHDHDRDHDRDHDHDNH